MTGRHTCCLRLNANHPFILFQSFSSILKAISDSTCSLLAAAGTALHCRCVRGSIWKGLCCRLRHVCCSHPHWVPWIEPIRDAESFGVTGWCFHTDFNYINLYLHSFILCGTACLAEPLVPQTTWLPHLTNQLKSTVT